MTRPEFPPDPAPGTETPEDIELDLLLEGVRRVSGHDFREYARATVRRRVLHCVANERLPSISALQGLVLRDPSALRRLRETLSINVTEMFRDPSFFAALRERVLPVLRTHPFLRIWHAGCSTGEEVYSLAILLAEAGLLERTRLYATDLHAPSLEAARRGLYQAERLGDYARNYALAGGTGDFHSYFTVQYGSAIIRPELRQSVTWGQHNLATDASFNEFHLILCRNVLIYFNRALQEQVGTLLWQSLTPFGILGLGRHETLEFSRLAEKFETLSRREKLYRKVA